MKKLDKPIEFESEVLEETETHYIMSLPQDIQDFLKEKKAKYVYVTILDKSGDHP